MDEDCQDYVIDDAPQLYEKVALAIALNVWQDKVSGEVVQALKGRTVHEIPVLDRLKSMRGSEQTLLTLLFAKMITFKEFEEKVSTLLAGADYEEIFMQCVKELFNLKTLVVSSCQITRSCTLVQV